MKFPISLTFIFVLFFSCLSSAFAQDISEDWSTIMNDYSNSADFGKIISDTDYKKAVETKESYIKKHKKKKKEPENTKGTKPEEKLILEPPSSPLPLLVLPVDAVYENKIIKQGFYLVNLKSTEGKYFLELKQGNKSPVVIIEAQGYTAPGNVILKPQVSVENVDDKMIKINYSGDNLILESVLWKN